MRYTLTLCILFFFTLSIPAGELVKVEILESFKGKVVSVKDGDTIGIMMQGAEVRIRLLHIDAPEKNQAFGSKAKLVLSDLVFGKIIEVRWKSKDRYGRYLGELFLLNGLNINKEMVKLGYAWHFKKYSKDMSYDKLEKQARTSKRGLWLDNNPIPPWQWRKTKK
ncbi:MAG: thermonuclease family protein [Bacteroidia bacterium]